MFKNISLSQEEQSVILGGLLGDASLAKKNIIAFRHSTKQKEYVLWKHDLLKNISGEVKFCNVKAAGNIYEQIGFTVTSLKGKLNQFYAELRKITTNDGVRKVVTPQWLSKLTPLSLAVWWMDDGCLSVHKGNRYDKLCTHGFSLRENGLLKQYLFETWGIDVDIKIEKQKYYFLRFNVSALKKLISIIYPYVIQIPSMLYKVDLNYSNIVKLGWFDKIYTTIKQARSQHNTL